MINEVPPQSELSIRGFKSCFVRHFCSDARWTVKKVVLLLAASGLLLSGCARHYTLTLTNGTQIGAIGKPRLQRGYYVYKNALGKQSAIGAGEVTEIAPASMMRKQKGPFNPGLSDQ